MGCFSFMCKESGLPAWSSSFDGDAVRLFLLKDGKVIEEMHGHYDSYGRVFDENGNSYEWDMDWSDVCDLMFDGNDGSGIALVLDRFWNGNVPTTQSDDDPDQGWGKKSGGGIKVDNPYHEVYGEEGKDVPKPSERKFYRTIIEVEVLSEEPIGDMDMDMIKYHTDTTGDFSGKYTTKSQDEEMDGVETARALMEQGSDPEFFGLDENGNDLE